MDPLSPWDRVTLALTVLAIDPAGIKGLWLRARAGAVDKNELRHSRFLAAVDRER